MQGHVPVLLDEVIAALGVRPGGSYLDVTGGLGGHAAAILEKLGTAGSLTVCDYHAPAIAGLQERFAGRDNVRVALSRFSRVFETAPGPFDGILADFGISSAQLADAAIGIAFANDAAPLDMRLAHDAGKMARDLLAELPEAELADLFFRYGGERRSRRIAAALAHDRTVGKLPATAGELRGLCERVLGRFYRGMKIHPATKVFQALRIAVNGELDEVAAFLEAAPRRLAPGGVLAVISFHEGEDRLVKLKFRGLAAAGGYVLPSRKAVKPGEAEVRANPRARSARLRTLAREGAGA